MSDVIALVIAIITLILIPFSRTSIVAWLPYVRTGYVLCLLALLSIYLASKTKTKLAKGALVVGLISLILNALFVLPTLLGLFM